MKRLFSLLLAGAATAALAAPPPGHPSAAQAIEMMKNEKPPTPAEMPNVGKVLSSIDANEFTYIEVERAGATEWLAAPKMAVKRGSTIRYENGSVMRNFYSKLHKRTFPSVMFVGKVSAIDK